MAGLKTRYSQRLVNRMDSSRRKLAENQPRAVKFPAGAEGERDGRCDQCQIRCGIRLAHVMHVLVRS